LQATLLSSELNEDNFKAFSEEELNKVLLFSNKAPLDDQRTLLQRASGVQVYWERPE
jgi:hypothetical protein